MLFNDNKIDIKQVFILLQNNHISKKSYQLKKNRNCVCLPLIIPV